MASLDTLLHHLKASGASGATLSGNAPIQAQTPRGSQTMGTVANDQLERDIREIAPPQAQSLLDAGQSAQFSYAGANFTAQNASGIWHLRVALPAVSTYADALATQSNTSGQGSSASVPPALNGWNWGAFFLPWIWGIGNSAWVGLLALVPCFGFFVRFLMGAKGNEWGWRNRRWNSVADFQNAQKTWAIVGGLIFVVGNLFFIPVILSAIMFPVFARARENARRSACQSQLKQLGLGSVQYALAHNDHLPTGTTLAQWRPQIKSYLGASAARIYHCPTDKGTGDSYQLNPKMSGVVLDNISAPSTTPLMWDKDGVEHLEGRNVLFADGHVKWYREQIFETQILPPGQ